MQANYTGYVGRAEWRWVVMVCLILLLVGFLPFILVALARLAQPDWAYMGALHEHQNSATALARMKQGEMGNWLVFFTFTPEPHLSALVQPIYALLGQASRFTVNSVTMVFHVVRLIATLIMYLALYQLGASIWTRVRSRRIFFIIASLGSGLGWVVTLLTGETLTPDLASPHAFPFYASLINVHYPLAIAFMAIIASVLVTVLRPSLGESPTVQNGGGALLLSMIALAFLFPEAAIPLVGAFCVGTLVVWGQARRITPHEARWLPWLIVPALPIGTYYALTLNTNPYVAQWVQQQGTPYQGIFYLLLGLGLPFLIGISGFWRAVSRFEADGDRFMLLWLLWMWLGYLLPIPPHENFIAGMMLPIAYFATRSLEDFWLRRVPRRFWRWLFVLGVPLLPLSSLLALFVPILPLLNTAPQTNIVLETDYVASFEWLRENTTQNDVILASPDVSLWIPSQVGARVVYGHPIETMLPEQKLGLVKRWYTSQTEAQCQDLRGVKFSSMGYYFVDFMLVGPRERAIGAGTCSDLFKRVATFGRVDVFYCDSACKIARLNAP